MFDYLASLFSSDARIKCLRNQASRVLVEYAKANAAIDSARRKFEKTREHSISRFEEIKKSTFDKTRDAAYELTVEAEQERKDILSKSEIALGKVDVKEKSAALLLSQIDQLGNSEYPLHQ